MTIDELLGPHVHAEFKGAQQGIDVGLLELPFEHRNQHAPQVLTAMEKQRADEMMKMLRVAETRPAPAEGRSNRGAGSPGLSSFAIAGLQAVTGAFLRACDICSKDLRPAGGWLCVKSAARARVWRGAAERRG